MSTVETTLIAGLFLGASVVIFGITFDWVLGLVRRKREMGDYLRDVAWYFSTLNRIERLEYFQRERISMQDPDKISYQREKLQRIRSRIESFQEGKPQPRYPSTIEELEEMLDEQASKGQTPDMIRLAERASDIRKKRQARLEGESQ